ncbi:MAG: lambda exonuclease family protein [bacterium]
MRRIDCVQGTDEWKKARLGVITASNFSKFITPGGKASSQAESEICKLIAERITGEPADMFQTPWMARGNELESEARSMFELFSQETVDQTGLLLMDDYDIGCSPDGLMDGVGLEIKCPAPGTHIKYLRDGGEGIPPEYVAQVQGAMMVTGFETWIFMSYHPKIEPLIIEVHRDQKYIDTLQKVLIKANETINNEVKKYVK